MDEGKVALLPFFIIPVLDEICSGFLPRSCELRDMLIDSAEWPSAVW
ncbi:MAG: hypothetical protein ACLSA6_19600 [Holdemania massiliensis]